MSSTIPSFFYYYLTRGITYRAGQRWTIEHSTIYAFRGKPNDIELENKSQQFLRKLNTHCEKTGSCIYLSDSTWKELSQAEYEQLSMEKDLEDELINEEIDDERDSH